MDESGPSSCAATGSRLGLEETASLPELPGPAKNPRIRRARARARAASGPGGPMPREIRLHATGAPRIGKAAAEAGQTEGNLDAYA